MEDRVIVIGDRRYQVKRTVARGRRAIARLKGDVLSISIPPGLTAARANSVFEDVLASAAARLSESPPPPVVHRGVRAISIEPGQTIEVLGKAFHVEAREGASPTRSTVRLLGNVVRINLATGLTDAARAEHVADLARRAISAGVLPELERRVKALNDRHFGFRVGRVSLRDQSSRWGSCSVARNMNLNFRLLFAPPEVLDYVIVHELAHLKEQNHGPRFWALVRCAAPDYEAAKRWLKLHGYDLGVSEAGDG